MLLQLFRIRKTYKDIKEAKTDPRGFATGQIRETALGAILGPLVPMLVLVTISFVVGYIVGDGSGFFKVLFWIFFIPTCIFSVSMLALYRGVKKLSKTTARDNTNRNAPSPDAIHVEARDAE